MNKRVKTLKKYAELDGCEVGDLCMLLCDIASFPGYMSGEFRKALYKEIDLQLDNFKQHSKIVEKEETITHRVVGLEWD